MQTEPDDNSAAPTETTAHSPAITRRTLIRTGRISLLSVVFVSIGGTTPALAQMVGTTFCTTPLAETVRNLFTIIQFGGPLIGGVIALGAIVIMPTARRVEFKKELKEIRDQAIVWGILVAPLATEMIKFLLNNVVAGGASCAF